MSRLTRDETAEPVPQILRRKRGQGNIYFPCSADHVKIGNLTGLIRTRAICDDRTYLQSSLEYCYLYHRATVRLLYPRMYEKVEPSEHPLGGYAEKVE